MIRLKRRSPTFCQPPTILRSFVKGLHCLRATADLLLFQAVCECRSHPRLPCRITSLECLTGAGIVPRRETESCWRMGTGYDHLPHGAPRVPCRDSFVLDLYQPVRDPLLPRVLCVLCVDTWLHRNRVGHFDPYAPS